MKQIFQTVLSIRLLNSLVFNGLHAQNVKLNKGTVLHVKLHGESLNGNLDGDSTDRHVSVYLPAGYKTNPKRHYPVVYFLHGFTDNDSKWYGLTKHWINLPAILDTVFSLGRAKEMIFVTPDADTKFRGSMYSNSITTGNWEDFVAKELVAYMDANYRTIPKAASRGLAGHSMGGYGTMRIGERHPDVFSGIYLLSPASLAPIDASTMPHGMLSAIEAVKTNDDITKADFFVKYALASAAAWSPNPNNPPLFLDLPVKNGQPVMSVLNKWAANAPLASLDQYITNLKQLHAIAFDAGNQDKDIAANITLLNTELNKYGIKHTYEVYTGTHIDHIGQRISQKVVAFFSDNLSF